MPPRPGVDQRSWQAGTLDVVLCELAAPSYIGHAPRWPDEIEAASVIYPHRLGLMPPDVSSVGGPRCGWGQTWVNVIKGRLLARETGP
jgi:hypothetical protein